MDETLFGLLVAADGGPPKKSRPNKELLDSACFGDVAFLAGADGKLGVLVVFGRAGGDGMSPKTSEFGTSALATAAFRVGEGNFCCEAERSSFAFSWTTLRGCEMSANIGSICPRKYTTHNIIIIVVI